MTELLLKLRDQQRADPGKVKRRSWTYFLACRAVNNPGKRIRMVWEFHWGWFHKVYDFRERVSALLGSAGIVHEYGAELWWRTELFLFIMVYKDQ